MVDKRTPSLCEEVVGANTTRPALAIQCSTIKKASSSHDPNVICSLFGGRKGMVCLLMWDTRGKQRETLKEQEEFDRRALTGFIMFVEVPTEVEAKQVAA